MKPRAALAVDDDLGSPDAATGPLDSGGLFEDLAAIAQEGDVVGGKGRAAFLARLRSALDAARDASRRSLGGSRRGLDAARTLAEGMDAIVLALHRMATQVVFPLGVPSSSERLTVAAVGGYGRGTLAPGSDIDLLVLLPYRSTPWVENVIEFMLYSLWDLGLKVGHATRTPTECIKLARSDMTIRTSLLEARRIAGDEALFAELRMSFEAEIARASPGPFIEAKLAERDARHTRIGRTRYLVEPNVKDGKGGLRDLQTLDWIARACLGDAPRRALLAAGLLNDAEHRRFRACEDFLWAVRCHLHLVAGRPEERLGFEHQVELAESMAYKPKGGLRAVERFMKHYFLVAKAVGDLTRIVCAALEERQNTQAPALNRLIRAVATRRRQVKGSDDFIVERGRILPLQADAFSRDPVNLVRVFRFAAEHGLVFHPETLRLITRSLPLIDDDLREHAEANALFLDVLTHKENGELALRRMNETGVLGRFVPEFGRVVAMMQFNMYHHFTVDEHLIQTVGNLAALERGEFGEDHPLIDEVLPAIEDRRALYVALFLHDIAKGRDEDHSILGARIAGELCPRLGLDERETELVSWLVLEHLTMSIVAQSRDLADRRTILDFAARVQSLDRMRLLLVLTVCDIRAVGPGVWTGWKGTLLRALYAETEPILTGGFTRLPRTHAIETAKDELAKTFSDWSEAERVRLLEMHYPAYWLRTEPEERVRHAALIRRADQEDLAVACEIRPMMFEGATEITLFTPDHPRLLSLVAGACAAQGANIVEAQIFTTTDGRALDRVLVSRAFEKDFEEKERAERIVETLRHALEGRARLEALIAPRRARPAKRQAFSLRPRVTLTNELSDRFSVVTVECLDRPGLLYDLTRTLGELNLDIVSAHIATFGEKAQDSFYITDLLGHQIKAGNRHARIVERLVEAAAGEASRERGARVAEAARASGL